jgi:SecD/SecF fusion protein
MHPILILASLVAIPFASAAIGWVFAWCAGRPAEFWRTSLPVFVALVSALGIVGCWPPQLGFDLAGGVRLVYEMQQPVDGERDGASVSQLAETLRHRIDPQGTGGMIVRPRGTTQVEIMVPKRPASEMEHIKAVVTPAGHLQFRVLVDAQKDEIVCRRADDPGQAESRVVTDRAGEPVAEWVKIGTVESGEARLRPEELDEHKTRTDPVTGDTEILILRDPFNVDGQHLASAWAGYDSRMQNCIHFTMSRRGGLLFGALTGANLPDRHNQFYRKLGIIIDGDLISAPRIMSRISDRGQITGDFSLQEAELLAGVLNAGSLPVPVKPVPISEDPIRGGPRIQWAQWSLAAALAALLVMSAITVFRFGGHGFAAVVAAWLSWALLAAGLLASGMTFTFLTVAVACAVAVALAIILAALGGLTRTRQTASGDSTRPASPTRLWPVRTVAAFVPLCAVAAVIYVLGFGEVREIAQLLVVASLSGMASVVFCFWPLMGLLETPAGSAETESGVVTAELSEEDAGRGR